MAVTVEKRDGELYVVVQPALGIVQESKIGRTVHALKGVIPHSALTAGAKLAKGINGWLDRHVLPYPEGHENTRHLAH